MQINEPRIYHSSSHAHLRDKLRKNPTKAEEKLWIYLKGKKLGARFRRQVSIGRYIVDFYSAHPKLIIEVDGEIHNRPDRAASDAVRSEFLHAAGCTLIRFTNEQVLNKLYLVLDEIEKQILTLNR